MSALPPPGWYPDPAGGAGPRWWTGRDWSASAPAAPVALVQPPFPAGTTTNTVWVWLQPVLLLLTTVTQLPYLLSFDGYFTALLAAARAAALRGGSVDGSQAFGAFGQLTGALAVSSLLGLILFAAWVLFAFLDARELRRRGLVQPFPWPWSLLGVVHPIGRAVVVHRRTGGGLAPLWVLIGAYLLSVVLTTVLIVVVFGDFFTQIASLSSDLPTT